MDINFVFLWIMILVISTVGMYLGAEWFVDILSVLRIRWGISAAFAGTVIAVASTAPEVIMNITSATLGVGDIGLGNVLGSNILNIPILVLVAYIASRRYHKCTLPVVRESVVYHAVPYLGFITIVAIITLTPGPIYGFQWYDGVILFVGYVIYTLFVLRMGKSKGKDVHIPRKKLLFGIVGFMILAVGAFFAVIASEGLAVEFELSHLMVGLFVAAAASSLPEALASWHAVKGKESVAAVTSVIDDNIISITLAVIPLTLVITSITNPELYVLSLIFVFITAMEYTIFAYTGYHFCAAEVIVLFLTYVAYIYLVFFPLPFL
jgi:cation:H+ antiporter